MLPDDTPHHAQGDPGSPEQRNETAMDALTGAASLRREVELSARVATLQREVEDLEALMARAHDDTTEARASQRDEAMLLEEQRTRTEAVEAELEAVRDAWAWSMTQRDEEARSARALRARLDALERGKAEHRAAYEELERRVRRLRHHADALAAQHGGNDAETVRRYRDEFPAPDGDGATR